MPTNETFPVILNIARQAAMVSEEDISELRQYFEHRHAIGSVLDPTQYINDADMADRCERLVKSFEPFAKESRTQMSGEMR